MTGWKDTYQCIKMLLKELRLGEMISIFCIHFYIDFFIIISMCHFYNFRDIKWRTLKCNKRVSWMSEQLCLHLVGETDNNKIACQRYSVFLINSSEGDFPNIFHDFWCSWFKRYWTSFLRVKSAPHRWGWGKERSVDGSKQEGEL